MGGVLSQRHERRIPAVVSLAGREVAVERTPGVSDLHRRGPLHRIGKIIAGGEKPGCAHRGLGIRSVQRIAQSAADEYEQVLPRVLDIADGTAKLGLRRRLTRSE